MGLFEVVFHHQGHISQFCQESVACQMLFLTHSLQTGIRMESVSTCTQLHLSICTFVHFCAARASVQDQKADGWTKLFMHIDGCLLICLLSALSIPPSVCICLMNRILQPAVSHQKGRIESCLLCSSCTCAVMREIGHP